MTHRPNIWLDKKNHDRIQNWLSEQHEFAGYPPPEEESTCSLRSSSAVDVLSNDRSPLEEKINHFPKYKSEERIHSTHRETDEQRRATALGRRYNSPDCIRRRYISPRSDPNINTAGNLPGVFTARSSSYKHLPPWSGNHETNPDYMNQTFYQGGKGNTFPRRAPLRNTTRNLVNITPNSNEMGQQMEKYQQRVLLNPHASSDYLVNNNNYDPFIINESKKIDEPLLAGRTFVLNGITLQNKQSNVNQPSEKENSTVVANTSSVDNTPVALTEATESETIKETEKLSEQSNTSDKSTPVRNKNVQASFHVRVASAPATTDSNKLHRDLYWRNDEAKRRVSCEVRKVKALSWPKRAVLPEKAPDEQFIKSYTKRMCDNDSNNENDRTDTCLVERKEEYGRFLE